MSDLGSSLDRLPANLDETRRATLQAMAQSGQAGVDALQRARADTEAAQRLAIGGATGDAANRGASPQAQAELDSIIRQPGDRQQAQLAGAQGNFEADMARQQADLNRYTGEVQAGIGTIQASNQGEVDLAKTLWEQQQAAAAAKAAGSGGGGGASAKAPKSALDTLNAMSDSELSKYLLGGAEVKQRSDDARGQVMANVAQAAAGARADTVGTVKLNDSKSKQGGIIGAIRGDAPVDIGDPTRTIPIALPDRPAPAAPSFIGWGDMEKYAEDQRAKTGLVNAPQGVQEAAQQEAAHTPEALLAQHLAATRSDQMRGAQQDADRAAATAQKWQDQETATRTQPLYQVARQMGVDAGVDQNRVFGVVGPSTDTLAGVDDTERQIASKLTDAQRQGDYLSQTGFDTPQDQQAYQSAQSSLATPATTQLDQSLARAAGIDDPAKVAPLRQTDEYAQTKQVTENAIAAFESGASKFTLDENALRQILSAQLPNVPIEVKELVVAEVKNRLPSASYVPLPENELAGVVAGSTGG